jgi:hypothetical protein
MVMPSFTAKVLKQRQIDVCTAHHAAKGKRPFCKREKHSFLSFGKESLKTISPQTQGKQDMRKRHWIRNWVNHAAESVEYYLSCGASVVMSQPNRKTSTAKGNTRSITTNFGKRRSNKTRKRTKCGKIKPNPLLSTAKSQEQSPAFTFPLNISIPKL